MTTMLIRAVCPATAWCALLLCAAPAAADRPDPDLAKILEEWGRRQSKCDSVRYVVRGETTWAKGSGINELSQFLDPPVPSQDIVGQIEWKVLLDFASQRDRWEVDGEQLLYRGDKLERVVRLNACDGKVAQNSRPRPPGKENDDAPIDIGNIDMTIARGNLSCVLFEAASVPLFHGHGVVPTTEDRVHAGHIRWAASAESFYVHGRGVHEGRPCVVLRTDTFRTSVESFHEFWVDMARQAAIVRYAYYVDGKVDENYDVRYEDTPDGWMPASWTYTVYLKEKTHTIKRLQVVSRELSAPVQDQDFRLEVRPGMRIREVEYGPSANPLAMPPFVADSLHVAEAGYSVARAGDNSWWWRYLLWLGAALAVAAVAVLLVYRARKAGRGRQGIQKGPVRATPGTC
jgi:hypothetical protein